MNITIFDFSLLLLTALPASCICYCLLLKWKLAYFLLIPKNKTHNKNQLVQCKDYKHRQKNICSFFSPQNGEHLHVSKYLLLLIFNHCILLVFNQLKSRTSHMYLLYILMHIYLLYTPLRARQKKI